MRLLTITLFASISFGSPNWITPPERSSKGYLVPQPDYNPVFPRDHGPHTGYGIEWWYWVGHLKSSSDDHQYGFQSTIFRVAGSPASASLSQKSSFGNRQLYIAHAGLSYISLQKYTHYERTFREGWQVRIKPEQLSLQVGGIHAQHTPEDDSFRLSTNYPDGSRLDLKLIPQKPLVRFGDRGVSRKGSNPASVSWYWSYTNLSASGVLKTNDREIKVHGNVWMDHEVSSSQLSKEMEGWDWTCIQLNDGTEVMAYRLRRKSGAEDKWSSINWIDENGAVVKAYSEDFNWGTFEHWKSSQTGLKYPTHVEITAKHPNKGVLVYKLKPMIPDQEFYGNESSNPYWEGACKVFDQQNKEIGRAYLELAGYGGGLQSMLN